MRLLKRFYHFLKQVGVMLRKPKYNSKVFCIGFNKTGTTTIGKSLELMGYRNTSFNLKVWNWYKANDLEKVLNYTAKFDSADDLPWLREEMIPILDKKFPNSKFIYLQRDEESWKKSLKNWRKKVFGDEPDLDKSFQNYKDHEKFVMDYFKDRMESDIIILDVNDKNGFSKLANFLGKKAIRSDFPHYNKTSN